MTDDPLSARVDEVLRKDKLGLDLDASERRLLERLHAYVINAPTCHHPPRTQGAKP